MRLLRPVLLVAAPALLLVAACSGDEGASREELVDEFVAGFEDRAGEQEFEFDSGDAECLGEAVVDTIGVDRLNDIDEEDIEDEGLAAVDLDDDERDELVEAVAECEVDLGGAVVEQFEAQLGVALSAESRDCFAEALTGSEQIAETFVDAMISGDAGDAEAAGEEAAFDAFGQCPGALTELFVAGMEQGGLTVSDEARACIENEIASRGDEVAQAFADAADDPAASQALGAELVGPCQDLLFG